MIVLLSVALAAGGVSLHLRLAEQLANVVGAIVLSFVLGAMSFYLVESRVTKVRSAPKTIAKFASYALGIVALSAVTSSVVKDYPAVRFAFVDLGQPQ